jgi:hypothetical protein
MATANYRDGHPLALGVVGAAALLAAMVGEYLMHNPAQALDLQNCPRLSCYDHTGDPHYEPFPATAVILPNGSTFNITVYQVIVLGLGALILVSALACAMRTTRVRLGVLATVAVLLALTLVVFRAQGPLDLLVIHRQVCNVVCVKQPSQVVSYRPFPPGPRTDYSVWYMVPAAALGLLTAGLAFLPAWRRAASESASMLPRDAGN